MLKLRVEINHGGPLPSGGTKPTLVKRIKESDRSFLAIFYKTLAPENVAFIFTILQRPYRRIEDSEAIKASLKVSETSVLSLTSSQIRQFNVDKPIKRDVMSYVMDMFNTRNKIIVEKYNRNASTTIPSADENETVTVAGFKNNIYLVSSSDLSQIPSAVLQNVNNVFIAFIKSNDDTKDDW